MIVDDNKKVYKCIDLNQNIEPFVCRIENDPTALRVKMTLRSAARPSEHSRGTQHTLAFHLGHSRVTCGSLQLHLLFTCSSFIKTSFTWGSLGQQGVQWVIYNWQIRAWRPASTKHSQVFGYQKKLYLFWSHPCHLDCLSVLPPIVNNTLIVYFQLLLSTVRYQECRPSDTTCEIIIPVKYSLLFFI